LRPQASMQARQNNPELQILYNNTLNLKIVSVDRVKWNQGGFRLTLLRWLYAIKNVAIEKSRDRNII
jgi:hypothetical protein